MKPASFVHHMPRTVDETVSMFAQFAPQDGRIAREPKMSDEQLREVLSSNLCRCTGYENIIKAVHAAASEMRVGK